MIDKNGTILRNLEDQVQYLTDINQLASLGFRVRGKVDNPSQLVVDDRCVNGDVMLVGTDKPYHLWVFVTSEWVDLGEFPRRGLPGAIGPKGESIVGPRGERGAPSQIPGPAGKNGDGIGVDHISKINLSTGNPSITYNTTNGATITKSGQITAAGTNYDITVDDKLPIVAGDNITIAANETNNALKISAASSPVTSVNGKTGEVVLKTSDINNNSGYITNSYHDSTKQDTLVSGQNIKTINNQSLLGSGNITISGGTAGVTSLNGKTGAITLAGGPNVTIDESGNTLTINATGGGGGTAELPFILLTLNEDTYPITGEFNVNDANKLIEDYFSSILLKPSGSTDYVTLLPQASQRDSHEYIWQGHDENYTYTITGTLQRQLDANQSYVWTARFYTVARDTWSNNNVKQTTGFYRYDGIINTNPVVGGTYQYNDNVTIYRDTNGCTYTQGQMIIDRNGVISKVIDPTHARVAYIPASVAVSSVNGKTGAVVLKTSDIENDSNYVTTSGCVTKMMNQNGTNESNGTIFVGSGLTIENNILKSTGGGGGGSSTLYQHHIKLNVPAVYTSTDFSDPSGEATIEFSFYSPHAPFNDYEELFNWMNGAMNRWIDSCNGVAYDSSFSVDGVFSRIKTGSTMSSSSSVSYYELSKWEPSVGWTPVYYIKEKGMMDSHSLTDSAGEM